MTSLQADLKRIEEREIARKAAEATLRGDSLASSEEMRELRQRIMDGETTGDKIKDFVIVAHYAPNATIEQVYKDLQQTLTGHAGQFVLAVVRTQEPTRHTFGKGGSDYQLFEDLYLGVLESEELGISPDKCHLLLSGCSCNKGHSLLCKTSSLSLDISEYGRRHEKHHYDRLMGMAHEGPYSEFEIFVGDQAVKEWFAERGEANILDREGKETLLLFANMAELAGWPLDETEYPIIAEEKKRQKKEAAVAIIVALGMLLAKQGYAGRFSSCFDRLGKQELEETLRKALERGLEFGLEKEPLLTLQQLCEEHGIKISR